MDIIWFVNGIQMVMAAVASSGAYIVNSLSSVYMYMVICLIRDVQHCRKVGQWYKMIHFPLV